VTAIAHGSDGRFTPIASREERFWDKVDRSGGLFACWPWTGTVTRQGYGVFQDGPRGSRQLRAHRLSYEGLVGPIPLDLVIDHLCRNRRCINPLHMEPVTLAENSRRQVPPPSPTACPQGHAYTPENTYIFGGLRRSRRCRTCHIAKARRQYLARKAA